MKKIITLLFLGSTFHPVMGMDTEYDQSTPCNDLRFPSHRLSQCGLGKDRRHPAGRESEFRTKKYSPRQSSPYKGKLSDPHMDTEKGKEKEKVTPQTFEPSSRHNSLGRDIVEIQDLTPDWVDSLTSEISVPYDTNKFDQQAKVLRSRQGLLPVTLLSLRTTKEQQDKLPVIIPNAIIDHQHGNAHKFLEELTALGGNAQRHQDQTVTLTFPFVAIKQRIHTILNNYQRAVLNSTPNKMLEAHLALESLITGFRHLQTQNNHQRLEVNDYGFIISEYITCASIMNLEDCFKSKGISLSKQPKGTQRIFFETLSNLYYQLSQTYMHLSWLDDRTSPLYVDTEKAMFDMMESKFPQAQNLLQDLKNYLKGVNSDHTDLLYLPLRDLNLINERGYPDKKQFNETVIDEIKDLPTFLRLIEWIKRDEKLKLSYYNMAKSDFEEIRSSNTSTPDEEIRKVLASIYTKDAKETKESLEKIHKITEDRQFQFLSSHLEKFISYFRMHKINLNRLKSMNYKNLREQALVQSLRLNPNNKRALEGLVRTLFNNQNRCGGFSSQWQHVISKLIVLYKNEYKTEQAHVGNLDVSDQTIPPLMLSFLKTLNNDFHKNHRNFTEEEKRERIEFLDSFNISFNNLKA